eukprot:72984-Chlamydomonas_euryale.AAC.2
MVVSADGCLGGWAVGWLAGWLGGFVVEGTRQAAVPHHLHLRTGAHLLQVCDVARQVDCFDRARRRQLLRLRLQAFEKRRQLRAQLKRVELRGQKFEQFLHLCRDSAHDVRACGRRKQRAAGKHRAVVHFRRDRKAQDVRHAHCALLLLVGRRVVARLVSAVVRQDRQRRKHHAAGHGAQVVRQDGLVEGLGEVEELEPSVRMVRVVVAHREDLHAGRAIARQRQWQVKVNVHGRAKCGMKPAGGAQAEKGGARQQAQCSGRCGRRAARHNSEACGPAELEKGASKCREG